MLIFLFLVKNFYLKKRIINLVLEKKKRNFIRDSFLNNLSKFYRNRLIQNCVLKKLGDLL